MSEDEKALQIVDAIDTERKLRGWTYHRLAGKAGLTDACVTQVSRRLRTPNLLTVIKLAEALGMTIEIRK